jgi:polo-like kinase 1
MDNESKKKYIEEKIPNPFGQMGIKKYEKGRFLGKGGFAKCYELTCQETKRVYAAKIILKKTLTKTRQKNKVSTLPSCNLHRGSILTLSHSFNP